MFAVQGALGDPAHLRTHVDISAALATPVHDSFRQIEVGAERQLQQAQSRMTQEEPLQRSQQQPFSL
jgi:hypothetical protein